MKYRMVKVERGEDVWFEAEYRRFFFWLSCFNLSRYGGAARYNTWEDAADAIRRHKRLFVVEKRTVVRDY
jgi:hypothetical protein